MSRRPFIAIRGQLTEAIVSRPGAVRQIIDKWAELGFTPGIVPQYLANYVDPYAAAASLCDQFVGGRDRFMWMLFDVLQELNIYPKTVKDYSEIEEWHQRTCPARPRVSA